MSRTPSLVARILAPALTVAALSGVAVADEPTPAPTSPIRFPSLAPDGVRTELDAEVGIGFYDGADDNLFSTNLTAQFMSPEHMGGYVRINAVSMDDVQALSNLELGGLYHSSSDRGEFTARVGVVVPTGPDADDGFDAFVPIIHMATRRPSDLVAAAVDSTVMRLAVSPAAHSGALFGRADVGVDIVVDGPGDDQDPLYHVDLAAGIKQGPGSATVELSSLGSLGTDDNDDGTFDAITLGGQYESGSTTVGAGVTFPFDTFDDGGLGVQGKVLFVNVSAGM